MSGKEGVDIKVGPLIGIAVLLVCLVGVAVLALAPLPAKVVSVDSTKILDRRGRLLYELPVADGGTHTALPLSQISPLLQQATIATEDASFYRNPGFDIPALVRAFIQNLRGREVVSGASTITQQLARTLYFTPEERASRSLWRKLREAFLAFRLNQQMSKDEVLETYLNQTYYGHLAYGVEAAARTYFDKSAASLDLAEASLLAGLPQAPAAYDLFSHLDAAKQRQAIVLERMQKEGYITGEQARAALEEPVHLVKAAFPIQAPHFVAYVLQWLEGKFGAEVAERGGLTVYTSLDLDMQNVAEEFARKRVAALKENDATDAALVAVDVASGQVLAMVGSPDYFDESIDGAVNMAVSPRQPGSALKPITYAAAFARGYTPATPILDVPVTLLTQHNQPYAPNNYDATFHGPVSARFALASSFNVPAVRVMQDIGVDTVLRLAWDLGITTLRDTERYDLSLTLGGGEVSLLDLTEVYAGFAAQGQRREPVSVLRVRDSSGRNLYSSDEVSGQQVISPQVAYLITDILSDNDARAPGFGLDSPLRLSRPAAVKTGTTTDFHDNWTVGYTPDLAVGVWVGNANNSPMRDVSGVTGAAPLWHDFMEEVLKTAPVREFTRPDGLVQEEVCEPTGLKPGPWCQERRMETFVAGTQPTQTENYYRALPACIDGRNISQCPPESIVQKVFTYVPEEAIPWARSAGLPLPPELLGSNSPPADGRSRNALWVSLISPGSETTLAISREIPLDAQQLTVEAVVGDQQALDRVEVFGDGKLLDVVPQAPYLVRWRLVEGEHVFQAVAYDSDGHRVESKEVHVTVLD